MQKLASKFDIRSNLGEICTKLLQKDLSTSSKIWVSSSSPVSATLALWILTVIWRRWLTQSSSWWTSYTLSLSSPIVAMTYKWKRSIPPFQHNNVIASVILRLSRWHFKITIIIIKMISIKMAPADIGASILSADLTDCHPSSSNAHAAWLLPGTWF